MTEPVPTNVQDVPVQNVIDPVADPVSAAVVTNAAPVEVDADKMLERIRILEKAYAKLLASVPTPIDSTDAALQDLSAHVAARQIQSPSIDLSGIKTALATVVDKVKTGATVAESDISRLRLAVDDVTHLKFRHELDYFDELVRNVHRAVLDAADAAAAV